MPDHFSHHKYMLPAHHIHSYIASGALPLGAQTIFFLLFVFWLVAIGYYLLGRVRDSNRSHQHQQASIPYYQPSPPSVASQQKLYQQGYQVVHPPLSPEQPQGSIHHWQEYEEPQALYPEMPPQQGY